jgi:hypothetical protein
LSLPKTLSDQTTPQRFQNEQRQAMALGKEILRKLLPVEGETRRHQEPEMGMVI